MRYRILILLLTLGIYNSIVYGATIQGHVKSADTKEQLIAAEIHLDKTSFFTSSGFDGSYTIKDVPVGTYTLKISYLGYETFTKSVSVTSADSKVTVEASLKPNTELLDELVIYGKIDKESERSARKSEKEAENIINVMPAKTIELLPDLTTAGVLQRVPGISIERTSTGDARYAIIRGMDQRYNYTLVNGIKIPSPDNKFRYVPMDMFPADLLERLEVMKTLTPEMEGDAIGGAMNLVMKNAPTKRTINLNVGTGFNTLLTSRGYENFDKSVVNFQSPVDINGPDYVATPYDFTYKNFDYQKRNFPMNTVLGFSFGDRFLKNKKLGVVVAASYQNLFRGSNSIWFRPENQPQPGNIPTFDGIFTRTYNTQQTRTGIHTKIDYNIKDNHKISLYGLLMELDEAQNRYTIDTSLTIGRSGTGTGNTYILHRSRIQNQRIGNVTLQGNHKFTKSFQVNWSGVYSKASAQTPDWSEYQTVQVVGYDIEGNHVATPQVLNIPFYRIWTRNSDRDWAGYLNLKYHRKIMHQDVTISAGGLYRDKFRDNVYNNWNLIPNNSSTGQPIPYDGNLTPDKFHFNGTSAAQGNRVNPLTYTATEKILAYYIQAKIILFSKIEILGGVRVENTEQGWKTVQDPKISYGAYGTVPYQDVLPSVNIKYAINGHQNLRFSYYSALNRPGFFEYVPFTVNGDNFSLSGNPKLQHTTSNNFDMRYEWFQNLLDQVLMGAFYKKINNPIETAVLFTGTSSASLQPNNFGTATNYGFELSVTKYYGKIGFQGNYTYTHSSITTAKLYYDTNFVAVQTTQTRSLQGQSPHVGNLSIIYKNQDNGLEAQLALVYTGKKITFVSPYKDLDYWQRATYQLDFSVEKKFRKRFVAYAKLNNILNTPIVVEIYHKNIYRTGNFALTEQKNPDRITVQKETYGQNVVIGLRYKM
ncbi:MAG: TonB-dependent receptor [Bacteroidetes bacterium]|nr:TonB-dependent receptor [Bacteroidota bacterium]